MATVHDHFRIFLADHDAALSLKNELFLRSSESIETQSAFERAELSHRDALKKLQEFAHYAASGT